MARDTRAVGINTDFVSDVDVNVNPLNPVIHVRSFSDDPELVGFLAALLSSSQDIVIGAYQIEYLPKEEQGLGAAIYGWPYWFYYLWGSSTCFCQVLWLAGHLSVNGGVLLLSF